jgi:hypothetical protein
MHKMRTWAAELTTDTVRLSQRLLSKFRTGHTLYVDYVKNTFRPNSSWLDAGGGAAIFHDLYDGERELVAKSQIVVSVDSECPLFGGTLAFPIEFAQIWRLFL